MKKISEGKLRIVVTPVCYNEKGKIEKVIAKLKELLKSNPEISAMIVDDCSKDESSDIINNSGLPYISHKSQEGVGVAVRTAIEYACNNNYDVIVIMAGNDKDQPNEIPRLIGKIEEGNDFVIGSRYLPGGRYDNTPFYRVIATRYIHPWVVWLTTSKRFTDTATGFHAIRTSVLQNPEINLEEEWLEDYDYEMYLLYKVITLGYKIAEVPASKIYPPRGISYTKMKPIIGWWKMLRAFFFLRFGLKK
jgi:dolichol-phosphate mannosyltransferase